MTTTTTTTTTMKLDFDIASVSAWAMEEQALNAMVDRLARVDVTQVMSSEDFQALILDRETRQDGMKRYRVQDGTAMIEIDGPLMKRASGIMSFLYGARSMERIGRDIEAALDDSDVDRICLLIDSPGGTVDGTAALGRLIFEARGKKPILAFCHGIIMSAAYWVGSAADAVVLDNETDLSGSIGVLGPTHFDMTGMAKQDGVTVTQFYAGKYKAAGSRWKPLSKSDKAHIQGIVDATYSAFVDDVAKHRGVSSKTVLTKMAEARVFNGSQGVAAGLVDAVMPLEQALEHFKSGKSFKSATNSNANAKGAGKMSDDNLEVKVANLERDLQAKDTEITTMKADHGRAMDAAQEGLDQAMAKIQGLEANVSWLSEMVGAMENDASANAEFVTVGKQAIEALKADIATATKQVEGNDFDQAMLDTQLGAFGNDFAALTKIKAKVEGQRARMLKAGDINPDSSDGADDPHKKQAEGRALGQKIGEAHGGKVVHIHQQ